MDKRFGTFRKATFGGFNRKDVISYIEKIKNETFEYRCQVEATIAKLNDKIAELETALADGEAVAAPVSVRSEATAEGYTDIKAATQHLRQVADELCSSLGDFIEKLSQRGLCEIDCAPSCDKSQPESANDVESILSSLSFLSDKKEQNEAEVKPEGDGSQVEEILSALSFLY